MPGITASTVLSFHKHLGNWEMKSSTIMVLQTNKQKKSVLLVNFTLFFYAEKLLFLCTWQLKCICAGIYTEVQHWKNKWW